MTGPEPAERAWELAVVLMAANQAISYLSLASSIDSPNQEMAEAAGQWLRRLINSASELAHHRTQPARKDGDLRLANRGSLDRRTVGTQNIR